MPSQLQEFREHAPELARIFAEHGFYGFLLATSGSGTKVSLNGRNSQGELKIDTSAQPTQQTPGVRITVFDGQTYHSLISTSLDHKTLQGRIHNLCMALVHQGNVQREYLDGSIDQHFETPVKVDPRNVNLLEIRERNNEILRNLCMPDDKSLRYVNSASVSFSADTSHTVFADPNKVLSQTLHRAALFTMVYSIREGVYKQGYDILGGADFSIVRDANPKLFSEFARKAVGYLWSQTLAPGNYRVVLSPQVAGIFAHESFGHGYEADKVVLGLAAAGFHIGEQVGSPLVNIADFPGLSADLASTTAGKYFFDDEGNLVEKPTILVANGVLQPTPITDNASYNALRQRVSGIRLTPNARLERLENEIYARMSQTYFVHDPVNGMTFDDMIADINQGVYLDRAYGGIEDPLGWGIQVGPIVGYEIKHGKLTGVVYYGLSATGTVPEFLKSIDAVGKDFGMTPGLCGKGKKEIIGVGTGGTHLRGRIHLS